MKKCVVKKGPVQNLLGAVLGIFLLTVLSQKVSAAPLTPYFDFGPYYQKPQVLGFSFSILENLPAPKIPDEVSLPQTSGIFPGSPFYPLERIVENFQLATAFDPVKKEELRLTIASERLAEAKALMDAGKTEAAGVAVTDYNNTIATIAQSLSSLSQRNNPQTQLLADKVEETLSAQSIISQSFSLGSLPPQAEHWSLANSATKEVLDAVSDVKGQPAIPETLSTDIQKLKEEGLLSEEESNKLYSLKTRTEVREELTKLASSGQFPVSELATLDSAIAQRYPDVQKQHQANLQVAEMRSYQSLPQPDEEIITAIEKWQKDTTTPPPNDIKPYLWYNRAQDLAKIVNPSYIPPASPTPTPAADAQPPATASPSVAPSPATIPYIGEATGALPGDPTYILKQLAEQVNDTFTFDPADKARLKMQQAERRLAEAQAIASDPKKRQLYESTIKNYTNTLADTADYISRFKDTKIADDVAERFETQAARHEAVFEKGLLPTPQNPQLVTDAMKVTENAMDVSADLLGRPALPPILASRLGDLKVQGLLLPEEADDLVRSKTREEVREKIRKLVELGTFPAADAKKLDEAQQLSSPSQYNQLLEVRKVEELQNLRAVQTQLAQTPTLKATADSLRRREKALTQAIDISFIRTEDLAGREDLKTVYQALQATASARPMNRGQFGDQPPPPTDAVSTACPLGAIFKQFEGCVWADSGKKINDYTQYRCDKAGQYYSFPAKKCVPNQPGFGFGDDSKPVCPVGYAWVWQSQSCQKSTREGADPKHSCPGLQYYSFAEEKCVPIPDPGDPFPDACSEQGTYWSFSEEKCIAWPKEREGKFKDLSIPQPVFVTPDNPFYPVKGWGEFFQRTFAFTPQRREAVTLDQAKERLAEAALALKKDDKEGVKQAIAAYTATMQNIVADVSKKSLNEQAKAEISKMLSEKSLEQNLLISKLTAWADEEEDAVLAAATSVTILGIDKAADVAGEPAIPEDVKAKIEALPAEMITEEDKKKLLETDSRVAARVEINKLVTTGGLAQEDSGFLYRGFQDIDSATSAEIDELKKLAEIADIANKKKELTERVEKNEDIAVKLNEFQRTFEVGEEIPAEIRPYVRLTRIEEVAQTVRPDVVNLSDFQNRKDILLAVATLQQEYKPTREALKQVEDFRRRNPNAPLPLTLARIEALSLSLGVREKAGACFLPTPPFPANTPCPAPGAAIPITSYYTDGPNIATDKDGKPYTYGQGPQATSSGICPDGYHWMYDSGGWCMSNSGSYGPSYSSPGGYGPGFTPYSPYYTAPGAPGGTYPGSPYPYSPPSYYGPAPTYYTTNPPAGTVPGSGPKPTAPGQCPSGYHWMSDSGGWCMADGGTYVPSGTSGGGGSGSSSTPWCWAAFPSPEGWNCESGSSWDQSSCTCKPAGSTWGTTGSNAPSSYQYGCTPGNYWDGSKCVAGGYEGSGWSDTAARSQSWCQPPASGCGSNSYWDYGSCYCRSSSTYSGGSGPSPSNQCQGLSCGGGAWLDYSTCSCRYSGGSGTSSTGSTITCYPPSEGCPGGWYDYGTCSCKTSSSSGGSSSGSCPSGSHWMSENGGYCMSDSAESTTSPGGSSGSSSGSCPSGYHWMSENGGWCMQDGAGSSSPTPPSSGDSGGSPSSPPPVESQPPPPPAESQPPPSTSPEPPPPAP